MSEPNNNDWLERELAGQMKPARAPESLWGRIESARRGAPGSRRASLQAAARQTGWILWPAVVLVLFLASGDLLWEIGKARASMAPLTEQDLSSLTDVSACDIRSTRIKPLMAIWSEDDADTTGSLHHGHHHLQDALISPARYGIFRDWL